MNSIFNLIERKTEYWIQQEKTKSQSVIGALVKYIEETNKLREPQKQAIQVYLWLKFIGNNQKLSKIVKQGLLYDEEHAKEYDNFYTFGDNFTTQFLNQFFQDNSAKNLCRRLANDPHSKTTNWEQILEELLHNYQYPNYLFSLPMGAGKTYLMACFIYLDLYFASLYKDDKRFAHNFVVFAPSASKTAILPSLQTIKNFNPEWILPKAEAQKLKQIIQIEILDALSSKRKDKLQGNNPNLEKVNRLRQGKNLGLVFITNAEKVVLESYKEQDKKLVKKLKQGQKNLFDNRKLSELEKSNKLRESLSKIPFLSVVLDEVDRAYGSTKTSQKLEKKFRQAVNILNQHNNIVSVLGFSGTPYVKHKVKIGSEEIRLNKIQDIVYNYPLEQGIGRFLKVPEIKSVDIKDELFIKQALKEFFTDFDIKYKDGTKSKIVFYCPTVKSLNKNILPVILKWYKQNRKNKEKEILRYYSKPSKENKQYELPKENLALFNNLDKPYSQKRVILLVAVGTRGWDCKSLTAVVLPRQKTPKNFVLQTTCRCLREAADAQKEKALIYLAKENYQTLNQELKTNYNLQISDLKFDTVPTIAVHVRKPKLGTLKYKQVSKKYKIKFKKNINTKAELKNFQFKEIKKLYAFDEKIRKGKISRQGITESLDTPKTKIDEMLDYDFDSFIYDLSKATYGKFSETDLLKKYKNNLLNIFKTLDKNKKWITANPHLDLSVIAKHIASFLMDELEYTSETLTREIKIELLEWEITDPKMTLYTADGALHKFMPKIEQQEARTYQRHPEDLEEDFLSENNSIDPQDISFNYLPYKMGSNLEQNALYAMLKISELKGLEIYYNDYKDRDLQTFYIETPRGIYTPDFLIIKRKAGKKYQNPKNKGEIEKILILETKGKIYYTPEFRRKEQFIKQEFIKYNPNFTYVNFIDKQGKNDFSQFIDKLKSKIKSL